MSIHSIYNPALEHHQSFDRTITERFMTPEEMARFGVTEFKPARTTEGKVIQPPVVLHPNFHKTFNITKEQYLQLRVNGHSRLDIAKHYKMQQNSLEVNYLRLWGIKGLKKELAAMQDLIGRK